MSKLKVAILYGGRSVEHGVSINSARNIFEFIDKNKFEPIPIGIAQNGTWFLSDGVSKEIENGRALSLRLNPSHPEFITADGTCITADVVFPVLHGTDGEDGSIQGLLKAMDMPVIGTGVAGSAMSINKLIAKKALKEAGIPTAEFVWQYFGGKSWSYHEIDEKFGTPFMVKSANLGSSVGVSKVKSEADFQRAVDESFRYDDCILFEKFVKAREIECAVMGNIGGKTPVQASLPGEIIISNEYEFYTFDAKYVDGEAVKIEVPARIGAQASDKIRELSLRAYQTLQCEDFARVDLFLTDAGEVFVNEINTIPGFTNSSMFPMMWGERGISFTDLITSLIEMGLERFQKTKRAARGFVSNLKF